MKPSSSWRTRAEEFESGQLPHSLIGDGMNAVVYSARILAIEGQEVILSIEVN
jgi:hypothetical protein